MASKGIPSDIAVGYLVTNVALWWLRYSVPEPRSILIAINILDWGFITWWLVETIRGLNLRPCVPCEGQ